ncbi:MAG: type VI secretion system ATPase TssH, partial [Gemmatimonadetes bacterium]|nr:type VI secretion system ATPase TssH [Gemmatimonadota bacterium]
MIRPERLTLKAQDALRAALERARELGNPVVNDAHLLAALLAQEDGIVQPILRKAGVVVPRLSNQTEAEITTFPRQEGGSGTPTIDRGTSKVFSRAEKLAAEFGDEYISTEHLLLALAEEKGTTAHRLLEQEGLSVTALREALDEIRGGHRVTDQEPEGKYQSLERFTRNLTDAARNGKLDPVIGRDEEVRRVMQVLSRRTKNNPVLIG